MGEIQIQQSKINICILSLSLHLNLVYEKGKMVKGNVRVLDVNC